MRISGAIILSLWLHELILGAEAFETLKSFIWNSRPDFHIVQPNPQQNKHHISTQPQVTVDRDCSQPEQWAGFFSFLFACSCQDWIFSILQKPSNSIIFSNPTKS